MITGESGTGKELVARAIHHYSPREEKRSSPSTARPSPSNFSRANCSATRKARSPGPSASAWAAFEQCNGGTLFLDEIGDMPLALQGKILRVLQDGDFSRVGGKATHQDGRAHHRRDEQAARDGGRRAAVPRGPFLPAQVVRIQLPPLRQRVEDIRLLAEYFVQRVATRNGCRGSTSARTPSRARRAPLAGQRARIGENHPARLPARDQRHPAAQRHSARRGCDSAATEGVVTKEQAIEVLLRAAQSDPNVELLPWLEREFTVHAMRETKGNQVQAAKLLGITPRDVAETAGSALASRGNW
jgi:two-component system nitrogen regulation response regulator GlnG